MPKPQLVSLTAASSTPLRAALDQNEAVQHTVERSADELLVINTVLKHEVPPQVQTGEVAQALRKADELEERIQASAEELSKVNDALKHEIDERTRLEAALAAAKADLAMVQSSTSVGSGG